MPEQYPQVKLPGSVYNWLFIFNLLKCFFPVPFKKNQKILEIFITQIISSSCREVNFSFLKPARRRRRQPMKPGFSASLLKSFVFSSKRKPPPTPANPHSTVEVYRLALWLNHAVFKTKRGKFTSACFLLGRGG